MYHKTHIFNRQTLFLTSNPTIFPKYRTNIFEDGIQIPKVWTVSKQRCLEMFRAHPVYPHARDTLVLYSYSTESGIQRLVRVGTSAWCTVWCMRMRIRIMGKLVRELVWELVRYAHRRIYACGYGGGGRGQRIGGKSERERGTGRCITLTPRVVTCKCGVKTDVNIRTNGGVAGVRNGEYAVCGGFNELKKIKGHASISASRVNPSIRFEVSFGMKANPPPFESIAAVVGEIHGRRFERTRLRLSSFRLDFNAFPSFDDE